METFPAPTTTMDTTMSSSPIPQAAIPASDPLPLPQTSDPQKRKKKPTPPPTNHKKLPRLQHHQKLQKRPLLHPAIAAPKRGASTPKVIYISARTPFIASIKRVRALLDEIEKRASGSVSLSKGDARMFKDLGEGIKSGGAGANGRGKAREEEVILKATGKAIENLLRMVVWWQGQDGVRVVVRTGSVGAIDDVVGEEGEEEGSRVRRVSCLEVRIGLI